MLSPSCSHYYDKTFVDAILELNYTITPKKKWASKLQLSFGPKNEITIKCLVVDFFFLFSFMSSHAPTMFNLINPLI